MTDRTTFDNDAEAVREALALGLGGHPLAVALAALNRMRAEYAHTERECDALERDCDRQVEAREDLIAENARLGEVINACDMAINWHDPRIVPTADVPTYDDALHIARNQLKRKLRA